MDEQYTSGVTNRRSCLVEPVTQTYRTLPTLVVGFLLSGAIASQIKQPVSRSSMSGKLVSFLGLGMIVE